MATLSDIIETIHLEAQSIDSIFRNKPRYLYGLYGKEGLKKLGLTFGTNIIGMNVRIPSSCKVYKPQGFEAFLRAYLISCDGKTFELKTNNKIPNEVRHYLTNCDGSLIAGCEELYDKCIDCNSASGDINSVDNACNTCGGKGKYCPSDIEKLLADIETHKDSWISEKKDYFEFSSDLEDYAVVIEYISNQTAGAEECALNVDDKLELALEYYIKYRLLEGGQETMQQAQYYRRMYKNIKDAEVVKSNPLTQSDLISILRM